MLKKTVLLAMVALMVTVFSGCGDEINQEQFIDVNDVTLAYIEQGQGPPLLLLHGGGGSSHDFDHIIKRLSEKYTVYALDSRGQGKSSSITAYNYQDMAQDVVEFIEKKGLKSPALYGFSDGGIVGLLIAHEYPSLLSKMIVSGANINPQGIRDNDLQALQQEYNYSDNGLAKMALEQPNITQENLNKIKIPVLVLAGSEDMIKEAHTRLIAESIPGSQLRILEGETHVSYVLDSTQIADFIEGFLK